MARGAINVNSGDLTRMLHRRSNPQPAIKRITIYWGTKLNEQAKRNAVFVKGYQTGNLRRSIIGKGEGVGGGFKYKVLSPVEYAYYLEHGTRHMEAQPYMGPAFRDIKGQFLDAIENIRELSQ